MSRRLLLAVAAALAAAGLGVGLWLALRGDGGGPGRSAYLERVSAVCRGYARRLARIPAPSNVTAYGDVIAEVTQVVPLLRQQAAAMRAVEPPDALRPRLARLFELNSRSVVQLRRILAAARRREAAGVARGLLGFSALRDRSHDLAVATGIDCN